MAKGKKPLIEQYQDLDIVQSDNDEGNTPFFIIDDEYGVACDDYNFMLVTKKTANRTMKDDKGEVTALEQYIKWEAVGYYSDLINALNGYVKEMPHGKLKAKKVQVTANEINELYTLALNNITSALACDGINSDVVSFASLVQDKERISEKVKEVQSMINELTEEYNSLMAMIKEKKKIIIKE